MKRHTASTTELKLPTGKTMLDAVTFAATLVSKPADIDPQLDRVRAITASRKADDLTADDTRTLREVYDYIETYLTEKELIRSFTRESVQLRVYEYLSGEHRSRLARPLGAIWALAIGGALLAAFAPEALVSSAVKSTLAVAVFFAAIHLGAAWMFWSGLKNFKDKMRQAYLPICIGIIIVGVTMLQVPFALSIGQYDSLWFRYGTSGLFIMIAAALLYVGVRRFAILSGVKSVFVSVKNVVFLAVVASVVMSLLPRPASDVPAWIMTMSFFILVSGAVLALVAARVMLLARRSLGFVYKRPMAWFAAELVISGLTFAQFAILQVVATPDNPYEAQGFATLPLVISAFVLLKASTSFKRIDTSIVRNHEI